MPDTIVILRAPGRTLTKRWTADGTPPQSAPPTTYYAAAEEPVAGFDSLVTVLTWLSSHSDMLIVRGSLLPGVDTSRVRRTAAPGVDAYTGEPYPAYFEGRPRRWLCIDFDGSGDEHPEIPFALHPAHYAQHIRDTLLPEGFRGAACFWQASASAGHPAKPGVRLHLWFWCDRAVGDAEAKTWLSGAPVDAALYNPVQPHYTAEPILDAGAPADRMAARCGVLAGGDARVPDALPAPARSVIPRADAPQDGRWTPAGGRNKHLMSVSGSMRKRGMVEESILAALLVENERFDEPLPAREVEQVARSIVRYEPQSPDVAIAVQPVTEKTRQEAERVLKRVVERVKDDPEGWRTHVAALGPHLAHGAITAGVALTRVLKAFGDAARAVTVSADDLGAALGTLSSAGENVAITTSQEAWLVDKGAILTKDGDGLVPCPKNLAIVLEHAPDLQGVRWDPRFGRVRVWSAPWQRPGKQPGDQWANTDESALKAWLCDFGWMKAPEGLYDAVERAASLRPFDWWSATLDHCASQWDGVVRLSDPVFVSHLLGCDPSPDAAEYFRRWLISAVARAFTPGAKVDVVLVLFSRQGHSKGRLLSALLGVGDGVLTRGADYFGELTERTRDFNDKDVLAKLAGKAIVEIGENTALAGREQSSVKAFLSSRSDEYRAPWERKPSPHPRTFVLVVTTNEEDIFSDLTGNRRYKVVTCARPADVDFAHAHMTQIWGEAVTAYRAGEVYHYDGAEDAATEMHTVGDPWVDEIRLAIARNPQHLGLDLQENGQLIGLRARDALALLDVPTTQRTQATARRAGAALRVLKWRRDTRWVNGQSVTAYWRSS